MEDAIVHLRNVPDVITASETQPLSFLSQNAHQYIHAATRDNTRKAYQSDVHHFRQWSGVLPTTSESIIAYLTVQVLKYEQVDAKIIEIRNQKVIIDSDVAELYGVETKRVNEAVKHNPDKFPENYILELTLKEWEPLKSKFSTSKKGGKAKLPTAFTEQGLYMLATVLKSPRATKTTIAIIDTFTKGRN